MATKASGSGVSEQRQESSVIFSLQELISLERSRVEEEEQHRRKQVEAATQAKLEAERRARAEQEQQVRDEEERRRKAELRRRLDDAQIEAAKVAEIEQRRLEAEHGLKMAALAQEQDHQRQLQQIQVAKRKGAHPALLVSIALALLGALAAIVFFVSIAPARDARTAVDLARTKSDSIARSDWEEGLTLVAVAKNKDASNKDIAAVETALRQKIQGDDDAKAAEKVRLEQQKAKDDATIAELIAAVKSATDPKIQADLQRKLDEARNHKDKAAAPQPQTAPPPKKICPKARPGVPLDPECK